ncbi:FMN-dependent NADH-azoreductase [Paenibacillus baekrokdamisoli]|nr:hypothetical protein [Paenibacillus baekrokdamisoli]MBB3072722.1 FMN-dependent NADH-azoreductase [Paenibacillus baekrokdamisoli]
MGRLENEAYKIAPRYRDIIVEGHNQQPDRRDAIIQSGIERSIRVAIAF